MRAFLAAILLTATGALATPASAQPLTQRAADPADVASLDAIIAAFYDIVSGPAGQPRDWARDSTLYMSGARFTIESAANPGWRWRTIDHATYARESNAFLEGGFFEREIHRVTHEFAGMAHVFSTYEWTAPTETGPRRGRGINSIELVFDQGRWWITFAQWASETPERPIPAQYLPPVGEPAFATAGAFVGISVPDLDASVRWYVEKLGMRVVMEPPPSDGFTVKVVSGGGLIVELMHNAAAAPLRTVAPSVTHTTQVHGVFKAGVVVEDYERTLATLRARGVEIVIGPFPARAGQPANFIVRDNAGNLLQFFGR